MPPAGGIFYKIRKLQFGLEFSLLGLTFMYEYVNLYHYRVM